MTTPPSVWRPRNKARPCAITGCHRRRRHTSKFCRPHERRVYLYGHHAGRYISKQDIASYRRKLSSFLDRYAETPQVTTALGVVEELLRSPSSHASNASSRLSALVSDGVSARDVLEVAGAVWMYSWSRRGALPDDARLTYQLGYSVLSLRPLPQRARHRPAPWGQPTETVKTITPGGPARRAVGEFLRTRLGIFYTRVIEALAAESKLVTARQEDERQTLAAAFETVNGYVERTSKHAD